MNEAMVCWFSGLSGSGKSAIARLTERILAEEGERVEVLDGDEVRLALSPEHAYEIDADCPFDECARREVKGLHRKALEGQIAHFTGLHAPFDIPDNPDLILPTMETSPEQSAGRLASAIRKWGR